MTKHKSEIIGYEVEMDLGKGMWVKDKERNAGKMVIDGMEIEPTFIFFQPSRDNPNRDNILTLQGKPVKKM